MGAWPHYNTSTIRVLDGSNGSLLWTHNSAHSGMMSSVSLVSETRGRDALIFVSVGVLDGDADVGRVKRSRHTTPEEEVRGQDDVHVGEEG